jgi:hypothetical protein
VVFQRLIDIGATAIPFGWNDLALAADQEGGVTVSIYRPTERRDELEVEMRVNPTGDGSVVDKAQGLTVVWDRATMDNASQVLGDFLRGAEQRAVKS